ncbi:D-glycero-alpha-D-manno-heptose-1,7-bisphosphate 7-phosphatase [Chitinophaga tropicalis]|uniref:D,D-heptose 1,7-bisphosphate phosphatase n=1 Tax=Chitinophaga tropicalis TaxID=2683588 RepID=A0A7K1U2C4_9BACT|nr:HAD family hydrolase [Chitinophaga tropicalis]MVT08498.1 HAD-IIIA family hydrolase [Chitinophaga tropicalis]
MRKAIFIDKDGTLVRNVPWNVDPEYIQLEPYAGEALRLLQNGGYVLVVVTNQGGVAKGYFPESALSAVIRKVDALLAEQGVQLDGFFYCPHDLEGVVSGYAITCSCRKPAPGMMIRAAEELHISLEGSWMLGDILNDVEAGNRSGCRSILVDNGNETEWDLSPLRKPEFIAGNMLEAAEYIINCSGKNRSYGAHISDTDQRFY